MEKICAACNKLFIKPSNYSNISWNKRIFCSRACKGKFNYLYQQKLTRDGKVVGQRTVDLTGKKFNKLTAISLHSRGRNGHIRWQCKCDCGKIIVVLGNSITRHDNPQKSCGCIVLRGKNRKDWKGYEEISGQFWHQIVRGANGEKGRAPIQLNLTIQQAWELFIKQERKCALSGLLIDFPEKWDSRGTASLDRIDSSGDYELGNVQWVHKDVNKM